MKSGHSGWIPVESGVNGTHAIWIRTQHAANLLVDAWQMPKNANAPVDLAWRSALLSSQAVIAVPQIVRQTDLGTDVQIGRFFPGGKITLSDPWCSLTNEARSTR